MDESLAAQRLRCTPLPVSFDAVDYTCDKCGAAIQEGTAFCPNCGAPQIRVNIPQPSPADTPSFAPGTPAEIQPPAQPVILAPSVPHRIDWRVARNGILIAGVLMGIVAAFPFGFLLIIAGGAVAVSRYQRKRQLAAGIPTSHGAKIGAVTGIVGYLVFALIVGLQFVLNPSGIRDIFMRAIHQAQSQNANPAAQEIYQKLASPEGLAFMMAFSMAVFVAFFLALAAAGGAFVAAISRRGERR